MTTRIITQAADFGAKLQQVQNILGFQATAALAGVDARTYVRTGINHEVQRNRINCAHAIMVDMACDLKQPDQAIRDWFNSACVTATDLTRTPIEAIAHDLTRETHSAFDEHYRSRLQAGRGLVEVR